MRGTSSEGSYGGSRRRGFEGVTFGVTPPNEIEELGHLNRLTGYCDCHSLRQLPSDSEIAGRPFEFVFRR